MLGFVCGVFVGAIMGVVMMCCLQINRDDYDERHNDN